MLFSPIFVQSIRNIYSNSLELFDNQKQLHFLYRLYRATGEHQYHHRIEAIVKSTFDSHCKFITSVLNGENIAVNPLYTSGAVSRSPLKYKRRLKRITYYQQHPQHQHLMECLTFLRHWETYSQIIEEKYEYILLLHSRFKSIDWDAVITPDHLTASIVIVINEAYFLNRLSIADHPIPIWDWVMKLYPDAYLQRDELLYDQLFAYAHLLINESGFYAHFLTSDQVLKCQPILDFYNRYYNEICEQISLDLSVEILLCFQLCRQKPAFPTSLVKDVLFSHFNEKLGYFQSDPQSTLVDMEHFHALWLMSELLEDKLYQFDSPADWATK